MEGYNAGSRRRSSSSSSSSRRVVGRLDSGVVDRWGRLGGGRRIHAAAVLGNAGMSRGSAARIMHRLRMGVGAGDRVFFVETMLLADWYVLEVHGGRGMAAKEFSFGGSVRFVLLVDRSTVGGEAGGGGKEG
jgi:hypothetical protein